MSSTRFALRHYPAALDRRGVERAAATLAAKEAALRLDEGWELDELELVRREDASPLLRVRRQAVGARLSVAHADGLAVAAVTRPGA